MADTGNVFDNSAAIPPALAGQGEPAPAGNTPSIETPATPPEGQGVPVTVPDPAPAAPVTPSNWQTEFQTPEEMYEALQKTKTSYEHLRPEYTKATQELSVLRKGTAQAANQAQTPDPQNMTPADQLLGRVAELVQPIREQNEELMMQSEISRITAAHPDFIQFAPEVTQLLKDNPEYWNLKNPIETAYKLAKSEKAPADIKTAVTAATQKAYADKDIKVLNSLDNRTPVNNGVPEKTEEQKIKESILGVYGKRSNVF